MRNSATVELRKLASTNRGTTRSSQSLGATSRDYVPGGPTADRVTTTTGVQRADYLDDFAEAHGIDPVPEVDVVRYVTPAESASIQNQCVADKGWSQLPDGTFQFPTDQEQAFALAMYECKAAYPVDPDYLSAPTEAQWKAIFAYWRNETVPCLEAEGFEIKEPPSEESFLADPTRWSPDTASVREQVGARVSEGAYPSVEHVFTDVCPVTPPDDVRLVDER